jgi:hypothetical protein
MHNLIIPCILYMLPFVFLAYSSSPSINDIALPLPLHHNHYTRLNLVHPLLLSLLRDRELRRDQGMDHGGHVGYQEYAGESRRCAYQGGE